MSGVMERVGESLCRAPYVWLVATILVYLTTNSGLARIAASPGQGSTPLAIAGAALGASGAMGWVFAQTARFRERLPRPMFVVTRWVYATTPFLFAYAVVAAGGEQWVFAFGFVGSVALLVISARRTRREESVRPAP